MVANGAALGSAAFLASYPHWLPPLAAAVAIYAAQQRDIPMKELLFPVRRKPFHF